MRKGATQNALPCRVASTITILLTLAGLIGALLVPAPAHGVTCYYQEGWVLGEDYLNEYHAAWQGYPLGYTDMSTWWTPEGATLGYTAERRNSDSIITHWANVQYGGPYYFDQDFSVYRKTWLYRWYHPAQWSQLYQVNNNSGSC
jgi:hypothetical protein